MLQPGKSANIITSPQSTIHRVPVSTTFVQPAPMDLHAVLRSQVELKLYKQERRTRARDFWGPIGVLLAVIVVFATAKFQDALGVKAGQWDGVFAGAALICLYRIGHLLVSVIRDRPLTPEQLCDEILDVKHGLQ